MFKISLAGIALALCAGAAAAQQPPAKSKAISLADVAGTWKLRATDLDGSNLVEIMLTATADSSDWLLVSGTRPPIHERIIAVAGDSIVTEAGPYESFLVKGVQIRQRDVYRLADGKLVGTLYGTYALPRGDSTTVRRIEGTRVRAGASSQ